MAMRYACDLMAAVYGFLALGFLVGGMNQMGGILLVLSAICLLLGWVFPKGAR